ncbi:MAG: lytic transglycosylase domain-containing protein [archaeon]
MGRGELKIFNLKEPIIIIIVIILINLFVIFILKLLLPPVPVVEPINFNETNELVYNIKNQLNELINQSEKMKTDNIIFIKMIEEKKDQEEREYTKLLANIIMEINPNVDSELVLLIVNVIKREIKKYNTISDEIIILSQIKQESGFNPNALGSDGDTGLMQTLPDTAKEIANDLEIIEYDLFDPETNLIFGIYYNHKQWNEAKKYTDNYNEQIRLGLVAYNAGPRAYKDFKNEYIYRNNYHNHVLQHYDLFIQKSPFN